MTNLQEAKLAREAEMSYVTVAMVTDYDCWHAEHDAVTVEQVIEYLNRRTPSTRRRWPLEAVKNIPERPEPRSALKNAVSAITNLDVAEEVRTC